jgi:FAD/FMN-containing dehydrogenase
VPGPGSGHAQGEIWEGLSGLRKDNTGYDLRDLFIGSEGTLGIITAATMKLYPLPAAQLTAWAAVPSLDHAVTLLGLAHKHLGSGLTGFEVMGKFALSLVDKHMPQLRVPFIGEEAAPTACCWRTPTANPKTMRARASSAAGNRAGGRLRDRCRGGREHRAGAPALAHPREHSAGAGRRRPEHQARHLDSGVAHPGLRGRNRCAAAREIAGVRLVNFGHLGDGNLHYNVQAPENGDTKAFLKNRKSASTRWCTTR